MLDYYLMTGMLPFGWHVGHLLLLISWIGAKASSVWAYLTVNRHAVLIHFGAVVDPHAIHNYRYNVCRWVKQGTDGGSKPKADSHCIQSFVKKILTGCLIAHWETLPTSCHFT